MAGKTKEKQGFTNNPSSIHTSAVLEFEILLRNSIGKLSNLIMTLPAFKNIAHLLLFCLLWSCGGKQTENEKNPVQVKKFKEIPGWLGIFQDTLPCKDCPGLLTWLEIRPDGYYKRISTRIGEADVFSNTRSTHSRWKFNSDNQVLALDSAAEQGFIAFIPLNDSTLVACDSKGIPLEMARWKIRRRKGGDGLPSTNPG